MILLIILLIFLLVCVYFLIRTSRVLDFRCLLIEYACQYNIRRLLELNFNYNDAYKWFFDKHSYNRMLFSFRALKLENWFTKEELEEIKR